jgi:hypothetical protein
MRRELCAIVSALAAIVTAALAGCAGPVSFPAPDGGDGSDAGAFSCLPNLDGQIDASELQAALNVPVTYTVSGPGIDTPVDLTGQTNTSGNLVWDFSQSLSTDVSVTIAASSLAGKWYQASFPEGQWAAPIDVGDTVEGVYAADSTAIYLQGLASTVESPKEGKTLVVYGQPVALYRFPLKVGSTWVSIGTVLGGMLHGLPYAGTDTYAIADDAVGEMSLHDYVFTQVHRIRTTASVSPSAGETVVTRQASFLFECFGEIVRATSKVGEPQDDFTTAAEVRRLSSSQ